MNWVQLPSKLSSMVLPLVVRNLSPSLFMHLKPCIVALSGDNFVLAPTSQNSLHLSGRITPKSGDELDTMGTMFTNYLQNKNQTLSVQGESVQPPGASGSVTWLSAAFRSLTLEATLPGQTFDVSFHISPNLKPALINNSGHLFYHFGGLWCQDH